MKRSCENAYQNASESQGFLFIVMLFFLVRLLLLVIKTLKKSAWDFTALIIYKTFLNTVLKFS